MNDKTQSILNQVEEKTGMKLSQEAKAKLSDKETVTKLMRALTPADLALLAGAMSGKDGINSLAQNKDLIEKIKKALEA